jgi:hypothetical protein
MSLIASMRSSKLKMYRHRDEPEDERDVGERFKEFI